MMVFPEAGPGMARKTLFRIFDDGRGKLAETDAR
jgi:hypothetical protein